MSTALTFSRAAWRSVLALCLALPLLAGPGLSSADARLGGGLSFGSRGARTFSMPPATATAPRPAFPMQRSETPQYGSGFNGGYAQPRRFGFGSGLAAGLLGAGLLGLLTGHGFFGGLGGVTSLLGFLLQIGLIVLLVRFALGFFRSRGAAFAGPNGGSMNRSPLGGLGGTAGYAGGAARGAPITVSPEDFGAFERQLSEIQYAYSREDLTALSRLATPEMVRFLANDLEANRRRNLRNDLADVRLLRGDLAEAWREGPTDYATVAMRFACRDVMLDRATGRVVEGDPTRPVEATELWTFRRDGGSPWRLSAVQQTR
jgi:predicted lipid-binding transport protein (Tim44 family)